MLRTFRQRFACASLGRLTRDAAPLTGSSAFIEHGCARFSPDSDEFIAILRARDASCVGLPSLNDDHSHNRKVPLMFASAFATHPAA